MFDYQVYWSEEIGKYTARAVRGVAPHLWTQHEDPVKALEALLAVLNVEREV